TLNIIAGQGQAAASANIFSVQPTAGSALSPYLAVNPTGITYSISGFAVAPSTNVSPYGEFLYSSSTSILKLGSSSIIQWTNAAQINGTADTNLSRASAGVIAVGLGCAG